LDVSTGCIYVSRDVVLDEQIFPFSTMHKNAGARLKSEISCLHPTLLNPCYGDKHVGYQFANHPCEPANDIVEMQDANAPEMQDANAPRQGENAANTAQEQRENGAGGSDTRHEKDCTPDARESNTDPGADFGIGRSSSSTPQRT
jgi:hypothetical protein